MREFKQLHRPASWLLKAVFKLSTRRLIAEHLDEGLGLAGISICFAFVHTYGKAKTSTCCWQEQKEDKDSAAVKPPIFCAFRPAKSITD
ncbi:hypothetical protein [Marinobacter sp.]|uniref:hypothetical protein n=1 Tax=Marinobacter sp. TaxID=50741 RepID=UPI003A948CA5